MDERPQYQYRVVDRDGRLQVIPVAPALAETPRPCRRSLPRIPWQEWGRAIFRKRHQFDETPDGDVLLTPMQLESYIKLQARSDDLFYVTPDQQAVMGWHLVWSFGSYIFGLVVWFTAFSEFWPVFMAALLLLLIWAVGDHVFKQEFEPVQFQMFEPEPAAAAP